MNVFRYILVFTFGFCLFFSQRILAEIVIHNPSSGKSNVVDNSATGFMIFQVVKDQMVFDFSSIRSAALVEPKSGEFKGLLIDLKPSAANEMTAMTSGGLGKPANLIFNKKVVSTSIIQSPLGGSVLISGISKEDAQLFLRNLNDKKKAL